MTPIEEIKSLFGIREGSTSPWIVKVLEGHAAEIWFGENEFIGVLQFIPSTGMWECYNLDRPENGGTAKNPLNAVTNHVGGGMINFLSNKAKHALRVCTGEYVTRGMTEKANSLK